MKKVVKLLITGALALVLPLSGFSNAFADRVISSLTVSPPNQKIVLVPGETYKGSISVFSPAKNEKDMHYSVSVGSFSETADGKDGDDYGTADHSTKTVYNQMMDWITLDKTEGKIAPNTADTVTYTIKVPEDAPAGGQYASLVVRDESNSDDDSGSGVAIQNIMQVLSIIYAEVAGTTGEEGEIMTNSMPSFLLNGPLTAESMVKNNGNVHTDAEYTLQVSPFFGGDDYCNNEEKPETSLILPETERYHAQSCDLPAVGIFKAKQTVKIFGETSIVERTVILCPLWLLFLILFVIIAIVIWIVMKVRGSKKRGQSRSDD